MRAKTPLEVVCIPRHIVMKVLHRSQPLMQRTLGLIRKRRKENDFFKLGKTNVANTVVARLAAHKLKAFITKKMKDKPAGDLQKKILDRRSSSGCSASADSTSNSNNHNLNA